MFKLIRNLIEDVREDIELGLYMNVATTVIGVFVVLVIALGIIMMPVTAYGTVEDVQVKIERLDDVIVSTGKSSHNEWVVYTEREVFRNAHTFWHLKFNSNLIQAQLKPGMICEMKVNGFRISRRNILKVYRCTT